MPTYVAITPTRNEAENILRLAPCMIEQTLRPDQWIIVDNGSTDNTLEIVRQLTELHRWITLLEIPPAPVQTRGAPIVRAFHAGLRMVEGSPDVVVKLDADVSFDSQYFPQQAEAFRRDPSLGITGGLCLEPQTDGKWAAVPVARDHVRGAVRAYRWECLRQVVPLEERMGWDGIDELKARVHGWTTRSLPEIAFHHHRGLGSRESNWLKWEGQGDMCHFMGYRLSYLLAKTAYYARHEPAAVAMLWSYAKAVLAGEPRCSSTAAIAELRELQSFRALPKRIREKLQLA
jgi:poly-beta-1,6-N-acetyl-D-glucosamine synthase